MIHILTCPDGAVMIVHPAPQNRRAGEDDETFAARTLARTLEAHPEWKAYPVVTVDRAAVEPILTNRRFRNAWRYAGGRLDVDMPTARTLWMDEVRTARKPKLEKSDVDLMRAQEGGTAAQIDKVKVYRQQLRDITATERGRVDACSTPAALESLVPQWPLDPALS